MDKTRILVFSSAAISNEESNGRVLKNLLPSFDSNSFMNIYIYGKPMNSSDVEYHNFTDKNALISFLTLGICSKENKISFDSAADENQGNKRAISRSSFHYFLRNIVWKFAFGIKNKILKVSKKYKPNVILLLGANFAFFYKTATLVAKKTNAKLVIYTAEDYPLKKYNYMDGKVDNNIFSRSVQKSLFSAAKKAHLFSAACVYNSEKLMNDYIASGIGNIGCSSIIRIPSALSRVKSHADNGIILYAGNLPESRCRSLLEFADCLEKINTNHFVSVYGNIYSDEYGEKICKHPKIKYCGVVDYEKLISIFNNASFLLHIEGFDDYTLLDYKHAFSTKIADYLMLGIPFICYGSNQIAGIEYLQNLNFDFTIISKKSLCESLDKILNGSVEYRWDEKQIVDEFSIDSNKEKMSKIIGQVCTRE